jgi:hypothetical protein
MVVCWLPKRSNVVEELIPLPRHNVIHDCYETTKLSFR